MGPDLTPSCGRPINTLHPSISSLVLIISPFPSLLFSSLCSIDLSPITKYFMQFPTSIPPPVSSVPSLALDAIVRWPPSTPHLPLPPNEQQGFMAPPPPNRRRLFLHPPEEEEEEAASPMMTASTPLPAAFVPNMPPASFSTMRPPRPPPPTNAPNQVLFKTRLCQKFRLTGSCPFGDSCNFAHGPEDLRQPPPNWQEITRTQKICRKFYAGEVCPYGERCLYAHVRRDGSVVAPAGRLHPSQISGGSGSASGSHESNRSIPRSSNSKPFYNRENTGPHTNEERRISAHGSSESKKSSTSVDVDDIDDSNNFIPDGTVLANSHKPTKIFLKLQRIKKLNHIYADWIS